MAWDVTNYNKTPANNTQINGINIAEGCPPSNVNDALRQMMADTANMLTGNNVAPGKHAATHADGGTDAITASSIKAAPVSTVLNDAAATDVLPTAGLSYGLTTLLQMFRNNLKSLQSKFPVSIANGGTGQTTVAGARNALGLGNTNGPLPIANGGTGGNTVAGAAANLGFAQSINYTGWQKLPGGLIIQWATGLEGSNIWTFPIAFPSACLLAMPFDVSGSVPSTVIPKSMGPRTKTTLTAYGVQDSNDAWGAIAIGY